MGFTTANLPNGGQTARYKFSYDDTFSAADGWQRTAQAMAAADQDFALMQSWFPGVNYAFDLPMNVQIANATGGASWEDPSDIQRDFGYTCTVTINPGTGTSANFIRFLLVAEVVEMFMASQGDTWYQSTSAFHGADEGSKGEGLSRFLSVQFLLTRGIAEHFASFDVVKTWLNAPGRPNFVDNNPDDNQPDVTTGCTTAFIWFLHSQLNFSIQQIVAAGESTLGGVFTKLTGRPNGWSEFSTLVNTFYPPGITYNPLTDNIFPVPHLSGLQDVQLFSGDSQNERVLGLDTQAQAEVVVSLWSDNPAIVSVPPQVTIAPGNWATGIQITTAPITGPTQSVGIHASYAGTTLSATVTVQPRPSIIEGWVTDTANRPIAGATVLLLAAQSITEISGDTLQLTADANGFWQTPAVTPQFYEVQIVQGGYAAFDTKVTVGLGVPYTIINATLAASKPFTINGVVSALGGGPLAGAAVTLDINSPIPGRLSATSDAAGAFSFTYDPGSYAGNYTLTATAAGYEDQNVTFMVPNGAILTENIVLPALAALSGTVRDSAGVAVAGAHVSSGAASAISDASGAYSLTGLPPGPTTVAATAAAFDPAQLSLTLAPGAHATQDIVLTHATASVSGTVTNDEVGAPVPGAHVGMVGVGTAVTGADGTYSFTQVPAGSHTLTASAQRLKAQTETVQVAAGQAVKVDFDLDGMIVRPPPGEGPGRQM